MPTADELISPDSIEKLARVLGTSAGPASRWSAVRESAGALGPLALSERARAVRDALIQDLPGSGTYTAAAEVFRTALTDPGFSGWMIWPVTEAVAVLAVDSARHGDFEDGLALLTALTPRLTGEFALRTFLNADTDRTLRTVRTWTGSADPAVRRLASEGTRPRLPWAKQVPELRRRPSVTVPILDDLHTDADEVVRRSVANHLNDISRLDPVLAVSTARRWSEDAIATTTPAVVKHAMRTLIKQADAQALDLLGFAPPSTDLVVTGPELRSTKVTEADELVFGVDVFNDGPAPVRLAVDYVIHYRKANGSTAPRVFKLTTRTLAPGERLALERRHSFRPITTRRHYSGEHALEIQVNGRRSGKAEFIVDL
ncbi:DNA alkylation repair protein [Streptomyces odonnellii]|uniref:DNA alkylation repair protein n=1 Tax=Streptomyces odonnellii TaxID=1417980 RepID=UPI000626890F|nr:DNA alkylation repair protein [Streptomyces odonnellii]